jgi:tRNA G10  N-methylase Trm11
MEYKTLFILGRLPAIGRAELESVFGAEHLASVGEQAMASDLALAEIDFARLGGAVRLAKVLTELDTTNWSAIQRYLIEQLPAHVAMRPEGKLKLGLSAFDLPVNTGGLLRTGLELKKVCKRAGRSARVVPNEALELSSAQVLHNQLTGELGMELLLVRNGHKTLLAQTVAVQDINAYAHRDQNRPKRDARVGMLPPKLAQTIVNLATGPLPAETTNVILDPFCGTGVVLQEALLMGCGAYGTDLEPRMIEYTRANLEWLTTQGVETTDPLLEVGDATTYRWPQPFSAVASETYLGRPLSSWPSAETLHEIIGTCNVIIEKFLKNLAEQMPQGARACLAVPAWQAPNGRVHHLPLLDRIEEIGYNPVSFEHIRSAELLYSRPGQLVARELLVITRK